MANTKRQNLWEHANKLTLIAIGQAIKAKFLDFFDREYHVPKRILQEIYCRLLEGYCSYGETDMTVFAEFWKDFVKLLEDNRALCEFMFIADAAHSRTFVNWVLAIMRDGHYAQGMLVSIGEGLDWSGRPQKILPDDSFARGVAWGWTLGEAVHRQMLARSIILESRRVAILGAGFLPELSHVYGAPIPDYVSIDACDIDPSIDMDDLMWQYPGLTYIRSEALDFLKNSDFDYYDAVIMPGVMTYNMNHFEDFLKHALRVLKPGKPFLFDMQVLHPELIAVKLTYHWGDDLPNEGMKLMTAKKTIKHVKKACEALGASFEYSSSGHYKTTSALTFEVRR